MSHNIHKDGIYICDILTHELPCKCHVQCHNCSDCRKGSNISRAVELNSEKGIVSSLVLVLSLGTSENELTSRNESDSGVSTDSFPYL